MEVKAPIADEPKSISNYLVFNSKGSRIVDSLVMVTLKVEVSGLLNLSFSLSGPWN